MRTYPADFDREHSRSSKRPLYVVVQYFDNDETDSMVLTSSPDAELPDNAFRPDEVIELDRSSFLVEQTEAAGAFYGRSVTMSSDGLTLLVCSPNFVSSTYSAVGDVEVFTRANNYSAFIYDHTIAAPGGTVASDRFASHASLSPNGEVLSVNEAGTNTLHFYLYDATSATWELWAPSSTSGAGIAVSYVSQSDVLTNAWAHPGDTVSSLSFAGRVIIASKGGGMLPSTPPTTAVANRFYGASVKLSGNGLVVYVGSFTADSSGEVSMYIGDGEGFTNSVEIGPFKAENTGVNQNFGVAGYGADEARTPLDCSYDGRVLIVGELAGVDSGSVASGLVHVYAGGGNEVPSLVQTIEAPSEHASASMAFGSSVALCSDLGVLAVSAPYYTDPDTSIQHGAVFIYKLVGDQYSFVKIVVPRDTQSGQEFGYSISLNSSGSSLVASSPKYDGGFTNSGVVSVFNIADAVVFDSTVSNLQGTFQSMDRLNGSSSLGLLTFDVIDYDGEVSDHIADKLEQGRGLNNKVAKFYRGYPGIDFSSYVLFATQRMETFAQSKAGAIPVSYIDLLDLEKVPIFDVRSTNISAAVLIADTQIQVFDSSNFGQVEHGPKYTEAPTYSVGTVAVTASNVLVTGTGTSWLTKRLGLDARIDIDGVFYVIDRILTDTTLNLASEYRGSTASGLSYAAYPYLFYLTLDTEIVNALGRVTVEQASVETRSFVLDGSDWYVTDTSSATFSPGAAIDISGSTSNDGLWTVAPKVVSGRVYIGGTFTSEVATASVSMVSPVQFYGCARGAKGSDAAAYTYDSGSLPSRQVAVEEAAYLTMPGPMMALALMTGKLYNQSATPGDKYIPDHYHMNIDERFVDVASFENVSDDIWTLSDQSGVVFEFFEKGKEEGKRFVEREIYRALGDIAFTSDDGKITYKQLTPVLHDAATVGTLDSSNSQFSDLTHDMPNLSVHYVIDWDRDPVTGKSRERTRAIDLTARGIHSKGKIRHYDLRGISRDIYTLEFLYNLIDVQRDGYSGPPLLTTIQTLPSLDKYQIGDVVFCQSDDVRNVANGESRKLANAMEIQQVSMEFNTGKLSYDVFGSSRAPGLIIKQLDEFALLDSFYSTGGGLSAGNKLDAIAALTTSVDAQGVLHITAASSSGVNLPGNDDGSLAIYWMDSSVQFDSGVLVTFSKNARLYVMGRIFAQSGGGLDGSGAASTTIDGYVGSSRAGGGIAITKKLFLKEYVSTEAPTVNGQVNSLPHFILGNDGTAIQGLPTNLQGVVGGGGLDITLNTVPVTTWAGGTKGLAGAGMLIICRGITAADGAIINTDGTDGGEGLNSSLTEDTFASWSGAGAGGFSGGLLVVLDGPGSFAVGVEDAFPANAGSAVVVAEPLPAAFVSTRTTEDIGFILEAGVTSHFPGIDHATKSKTNSNLRIQRLQDAT